MEPKRLEPTWEQILPLIISSFTQPLPPNTVSAARECLDLMAKAADLYNANVHGEVVNTVLLKGDGVPRDPVDVTARGGRNASLAAAGVPVVGATPATSQHALEAANSKDHWIICRQNTGQFIGPFNTQADASRYAQRWFRDGYTIQPLAMPVTGY